MHLVLSNIGFIRFATHLSHLEMNRGQVCGDLINNTGSYRLVTGRICHLAIRASAARGHCETGWVSDSVVDLSDD